MWLSFDGNYSGYSPAEKREKALAQERKAEEFERQARERAMQRLADDMLWAEIRKAVLARDKNTCQLCGKIKTSKLHIHHVMKRNRGGTDHLDNLLTPCPSCHAKADSVFYDPDWENPPITSGVESNIVHIGMNNPTMR